MCMTDSRTNCRHLSDYRRREAMDRCLSCESGTHTLHPEVNDAAAAAAPVPCTDRGERGLPGTNQFFWFKTHD